MKRCKQCDKILIRRDTETPYYFRARKTCGYSCSSNFYHALRGNTIWDKNIVLKKFNLIKDKRKYNVRYIQENYLSLYSAVHRIYGKKAWSKFLVEIGKEEMLKQNHYHSKKKKVAKELINYWIRELDVKKRKVFEYSHEYGVPSIAFNNFSDRTVVNALDFMKKNKNIRLIKKGNKGRNAYPSQYVLLKTRVF